MELSNQAEPVHTIKRQYIYVWMMCSHNWKHWWSRLKGLLTLLVSAVCPYPIVYVKVTGVKYVVIHPHLYILYVGIEKHNDDSKRNYFSSNRWDAPAEIMMAEHRLELLQKYAREKRQYTKRSAEHWHEGGIQETRSQMREALKC